MGAPLFYSLAELGAIDLSAHYAPTETGAHAGDGKKTGCDQCL
jgi:hypothetical protein